MRRGFDSLPIAQMARLVLAAALLAAPIVAPPTAVGVGPLPECRLDDVLTEPRGFDDWAITQVDWNLTLGRRYRPPDLVPVSGADVDGGGYIREVAIDDLGAMAAAARENGTPIKVLSPFRGYRQQVALFAGYAGWNGSEFTNFENAIKFSARPGHSEHQTGVTIDFGSVGDTALSSNWHETPAGSWMEANAWKYGWLMSYPKGKKAVVCYRFEPWHYRYVGRELAAKIHNSGLTIREYLWANHTQVDPVCMADTPPDLETPGRSRSCPVAAPTPSPAATLAPGSSPSNTTPPATMSPGATPTATAAAPDGVGSSSEVPLLGGLLVALVAVAVIAIGVLRRPGRRRTPGVSR
jgi:LAS superfamily LD-carboxypeptidase LdcB